MGGPDAFTRKSSGKTYVLLAAAILLTTLGRLECGELQTDAQRQVYQQPPCAEPSVIQGRLTGMQGNLVTVKTPDGYPGGPGGHAQFVIAGPTFRVDVSRARVLLPDGRQADRVPLAVGDRVLMVLTGPPSGPPVPGNVSFTYYASIVERVIQSDKIVTH